LLSALKEDKFTTTDLTHIISLHFYTCLKYLEILEKEGLIVKETFGKRGQIHVWSLK
jgi:predicted transcriptional regulator